MNPPSGIEALPNGQWVIAGDTHIAVWSRQHGSIISDPHLFKWLDPFIKDVKVVWDIGANIGDTTRHYLNTGKTVIAVEPNPQAFECLCHNCPEATCINIAASDSVGLLPFTQLANAGASRITPNGEITVEAHRLDEFLGNLPAPGFVKIDIEGWEMHALRGMSETLSAYRPIIFCEINAGALAANGESYESVRGFLEELGYRDFQIYPPNASYHDAQFDLLCRHQP